MFQNLMRLMIGWYSTVQVRYDGRLQEWELEVDEAIVVGPYRKSSL